MNQRRSSCEPKWVSSRSIFCLAIDAVEMDEQVRSPEVAVVLRNLVLEDQVVTERVPGQLARQAVILMEVAALVGEDHVRRDLGLQILEERLDLAAVVRQEAVAKAAQEEPATRRTRTKSLRRCSAPPRRARLR